MAIYGLPQQLTGNELVTVQQSQNGQMAECSMPISELLAYIATNEPDLWTASMPNTLPSKPGVVWNNGGIPCIS